MNPAPFVDFTIGDPRLDLNSYDFNTAEGVAKFRKTAFDFFTVLRQRGQYFTNRPDVLARFISMLSNERNFQIAAEEITELRQYEDIDVRIGATPADISRNRVVHALRRFRPHRSPEIAAGKAELKAIEKSLLGLVDFVLNNEDDVDEQRAGVKAENEHLKEQVYSIVRVLTDEGIDLSAEKGNAEALTRRIMDFGHQARRELGIEE